MNRTKFEELKKKTEDIIAEKNAADAELTDQIKKNQEKIAAARADMKAAEERDDSKAYGEASSLVDMLTERIRKAEEKRAIIHNTPTIPRELYDEISAFLQNETSIQAKQEGADILKHLDAIKQIIEASNAYHHELATFAQSCEHTNKADYRGDFRFITLSALPAAATDELLRAMYPFRNYRQ